MEHGIDFGIIIIIINNKVELLQRFVGHLAGTSKFQYKVPKYTHACNFSLYMQMNIINIKIIKSILSSYFVFD